MANPVEMVNGKLQIMSDADYAQLMEMRSASSSDVPSPQDIDIPTQVANLTAAVVALGGTVPSIQITAANSILTATGESPISMSSIPNVKGAI